jgi:hypothetical protein
VLCPLDDFEELGVMMLQLLGSLKGMVELLVIVSGGLFLRPCG